MDGFVFFRLSYFDYRDLQLFAIFIFEVYFSETYLMTSAENSNFENFLGKENPRHRPPPQKNKARAFGTRDNAPRYKNPSYSPG